MSTVSGFADISYIGKLTIFRKVARSDPILKKYWENLAICERFGKKVLILLRGYVFYSGGQDDGE